MGKHIKVGNGAHVAFPVLSGGLKSNSTETRDKPVLAFVLDLIAQTNFLLFWGFNAA